MWAGVASRVITPHGSWAMDGYILRDGPSTGVLDDLWAQALWLDDGQRQAVLVTLDLVGVDEPFTAQLRAAIAGRFGVPGHHVLVAASHTHSGPSGFVSLWDPEALRSPLRDLVTGQVVEAVGDARHGARPCRWQVCHATVRGVGAGRNDPAEPSEGDASLLLLWGRDGTLLAVVVHYACHPTVLGPDNRLMATDFVGPMRRALAAALAEAGLGRPAVLFVNGAAADVSTRFTRRTQTPAEARRLGTLLAAQVLPAVLAARFEDAEEAVASGAIGAWELQVDLPGPTGGDAAAQVLGRTGAGAGSPARGGGAPAGDDPDMEREIARVREELEEASRSGGDSHRLRLLRARLEGLMARRLWLAPVSRVRLPLQVLAASDLAWIAIPAEVDHRLGDAIRAASPFQHTFIAGYANGYAGYILNRRLSTAGTYEGLVSRMGPGAGELLLGAAVDLLCRAYAEQQRSEPRDGGGVLQREA
ncbi:hypothetical protein DYI95_003540 [Thermaerobacter sp. PB12/4term]|uniref:neutral/alkaline non-lysosomal ceramidase N-terminal domain-containing protein n=1 Tax=Thermaerobacter sp. PB12/4term TaxID=2293838 RepID=UPI000E329D32|nr:neutral/alkaline non-lysosomal ceramidase N-terminal domain-containing protein [Thermaerobacter sp. PB12/4term]QIA26715.1 hypothetical protein DYI95_003540 [Thermaerobacter sp. PB12/4term]